MSLYGDYVKEREGFDIVENEFGFATYKISGDECYLRDIYVRPKSRRDKVCFKLADEVSAIAKAQGCHWLVGSVAINATGVENSTAVLKAYGFKPTRIVPEKQMIYYAKEIL